MMGHVLLLPLIIPFVTAITCLTLLKRRRLQILLGIAGSGALLAAGTLLVVRVTDTSIISLQIGDWPPPYGITLVADYFGAGMVLLTGFIGFTTACYAAADIDERRLSAGFFSLFHFMLMGLCGAFLTGDLFNFYVWFEVTLAASFVLICLGGLPAQLKGAIKYLALNLIASALLLAGIGLLYGQAGTLNMAHLAQRLDGAPSIFLTETAMLFFVALGIKSAIFPLFFWLPAAYHTPPAAVKALFAGLLTKLGLYAMIRTFTLLFIPDAGFNSTLILVVACATMISGALGAFAQNNLNRLLSFSIVSQMGYILAGLGLFSPMALAGAFFFILHESIAKTALFLTFGILGRYHKDLDIHRMGGVYEHHPYLSFGFFIAGLSLAGLPPFSGFIGKFTIIRAALSGAHFVVVGFALGVAVLTLLYILRVWQKVFWKPPAISESDQAGGDASRMLTVPTLSLCLSTLLLGLFGQPVMRYCLQAGNQLIDVSGYVQAVLGAAP